MTVFDDLVKKISVKQKNSNVQVSVSDFLTQSGSRAFKQVSVSEIYTLEFIRLVNA